MHACMRACVRACVRVCVRVRACVRVSVHARARAARVCVCAPNHITVELWITYNNENIALCH